MTARGGFPVKIGRIGKSSFAKLAERALEAVPAKRPAVVTLDRDGFVWVECLADADMADAVMTVITSTDPDLLAEALQFEAGVRSGREAGPVGLNCWAADLREKK
ncbi:MAG: hypothetical protein JSS23_09145 [Proteobacteria bacterium]|nr:hypothetical protein [Pseudomonadota bacterium]